MKTADAMKLHMGDYVTVKNQAGYWYVERPLADGVVQLRAVHSRMICPTRYIDKCVTHGVVATNK